jgi:hypothetical protein
LVYNEIMLSSYRSLFNFDGPTAQFPRELLFLIVIWSLVWKAYGLWKSAQNGQKNWFIAIFILNTLGVLEIIYTRFFQNNLSSTKTKQKGNVT